MEDFPDRCIMCKHLIFTQILLYLPQKLSFTPINQYHLRCDFRNSNLCYPTENDESCFTNQCFKPGESQFADVGDKLWFTFDDKI